MSKWVRRYLNSIKHLHRLDEFFASEEEVRKKFGIIKGKCADGVAHYDLRCDHLIIEEKSASDIIKAILQLEDTCRALEEQGYPVRDVALAYTSLNRYRGRYVSYEECLHEVRGAVTRGARRRRGERKKKEPVRLSNGLMIRLVKKRRRR